MVENIVRARLVILIEKGEKAKNQLIKRLKKIDKFTSFAALNVFIQNCKDLRVEHLEASDAIYHPFQVNTLNRPVFSINTLNS